jgi:beta-lactamase regulating signal transducer with metallopeptidase domain
MRGKRAIKRLRVRRSSSGVNVIDDPVRLSAFTHGVIRPEIYVTSGLVNALSREELLGVIRHEEHHRKMLDPLRLAIFTFLKDALFYLPAAGWLIDRAAVRKEFAADTEATKASVDPLAYAGALVKVARFNVTPSAYSHGAGIGGACPIEERVARLVGGVSARRPKLPAKTLVVTVAVTLLLGASLVFMPKISGAVEITSCENGQCKTAQDASPIMDGECARHCNM